MDERESLEHMAEDEDVLESIRELLEADDNDESAIVLSDAVLAPKAANKIASSISMMSKNQSSSERAITAMPVGREDDNVGVGKKKNSRLSFVKTSEGMVLNLSKDMLVSVDESFLSKEDRVEVDNNLGNVLTPVFKKWLREHKDEILDFAGAAAKERRGFSGE